MSEQDNPQLGPDDHDESLYEDAVAALDERKANAKALERGEGSLSELIGGAIGMDAALIARLAAEVDRLSRAVESLQKD